MTPIDFRIQPASPEIGATIIASPKSPKKASRKTPVRFICIVIAYSSHSFAIRSATCAVASQSASSDAGVGSSSSIEPSRAP